MRRSIWTFVTLVVAALSIAPVAGAQDLGDAADLTCGPVVEGPLAGPGSHLIAATGRYGCTTPRAHVGVVVCLQYNGVTVTCGQDTSAGERDAEASVSFACLPGVWTATAFGVATGGPPGAAGSIAVPLECDPLRAGEA